jgi:hypothetical protein
LGTESSVLEPSKNLVNIILNTFSMAFKFIIMSRKLTERFRDKALGGWCLGSRTSHEERNTRSTRTVGQTGSCSELDARCDAVNL